ncbi:hypothetical protein [Streptomyces sp. H39-S7]|uniref:hypothetical protein n=1 Tax=Streptomyces sp. H39-S7 TaxID=3004357 RepID=UPI0022AE9452|nr:hypothetical protein [Streptomyces sp. H39-S7]MCZ4122378.1 hypothetical protein [Streptomyces sp. H39-S7]
MIRLRIHTAVCPRYALVLTDTPRPNCPDCGGTGGILHHYGDDSGEYAGTECEPCGCWTHWRMTLLPLLSWFRRPRVGYSSEPPF